MLVLAAKPDNGLNSGMLMSMSSASTLSTSIGSLAFDMLTFFMSISELKAVRLMSYSLSRTDLSYAPETEETLVLSVAFTVSVTEFPSSTSVAFLYVMAGPDRSLYAMAPASVSVKLALWDVYVPVTARSYERPSVRLGAVQDILHVLLL